MTGTMIVDDEKFIKSAVPVELLVDGLHPSRITFAAVDAVTLCEADGERWVHFFGLMNENATDVLAKQETRKPELVKRWRGRQPIGRAPRDLPKSILETVRALADGGWKAREIFGRLGMDRWGIKLDTFTRYIARRRRARSKAGEITIKSPARLAQVIAEFFLAGVADNAVIEIARRVYRLRGITFRRASK